MQPVLSVYPFETRTGTGFEWVYSQHDPEEPPNSTGYAHLSAWYRHPREKAKRKGRYGRGQEDPPAAAGSDWGVLRKETHHWLVVSLTAIGSRWCTALKSRFSQVRLSSLTIRDIGFAVRDKLPVDLFSQSSELSLRSLPLQVRQFTIVNRLAAEQPRLLLRRQPFVRQGLVRQVLVLTSFRVDDQLTPCAGHQPCQHDESKRQARRYITLPVFHLGIQ
jgi:hypothetical protein